MNTSMKNMINQIALDSRATAIMPNTNENEPEMQEINLLSSFHGKWIILLFHPLAFTSVSPTEIHAYSDRQADFESLNSQVLAISCDSKFSQLSWIKDMGGSKIPLVSDFDKEIAAGYGVLLEDGMAARATFIISPGGIVRHVSINDLSIGRNVHETIRILLALQHTDQFKEDCPANWIPGGTVSNVDPITISSYFSSIDVSKGKCTTINHLYDLQRSIMHTFNDWKLQYQSSLRAKPLLTKALTSAVISALGEIIGSMIKSHRMPVKRSVASYLQSISIRRVLIFAAYGGFITGPVFHVWYGFLERFVRSLKLSLPASIAIKLSLNQLVLTPPFLLLTLAYLQFFQSFSAKNTVRAIKNTFAMALYTNWKIWTPAQAVNFTIVPLDYQVVYGNVVALWWNLYLSLHS